MFAQISQQQKRSQILESGEEHNPTVEFDVREIRVTWYRGKKRVILLWIVFGKPLPKARAYLCILVFMCANSKINIKDLGSMVIAFTLFFVFFLNSGIGVNLVSTFPPKF